MKFEVRGDRRPQGPKQLHAAREEYFRLVQQGYSIKEAAKLVGVHPRTRSWVEPRPSPEERQGRASRSYASGRLPLSRAATSVRRNAST